MCPVSSRADISLNRFPFLTLGFILILDLASCTSLPAPAAVIAPAAEPRFVPSTPLIEITPRRALVDEKVTIRFLGFKPNESVTLVAEMRDHLDRPWQSYATYKTDDRGVLDIGSQKPISGTYNTVDPMGLFWSMHLFDSGGSEDLNFENPELASPFRMTFIANTDGQAVATTTLTRVFTTDAVSRIPVHQNGLAGIFYEPSGPGPFPGVIILRGAEGGLRADQAALLASHGFASLALAYFNYDGLPATLANIPLEYFETAIKWLQAQKNVRADRIAVVGASRGGELALLLGATFPEIKAVVAYVPSNAPGPAEDSIRPAWTFHGKPLPYVHDYDTIISAARGDPAAAETTSQAATPVERINGPVLLISGKDDRLWPTFQMANQILARLLEHQHPFPDQHLSYEGAGHLILQMVPYLPTTAERSPPPITAYINYYGGTPTGDASAAADSWPRVLAFLKQNLR